MSDFYENPENTRLLKKVQLKEQSGMDIKSDVIELMAAAFESMSDEDWIDYEQKSGMANDIFQKYYPVLPDIPIAAVSVLVSRIPDIISELDNAESSDVEFLYHLCLSTIWAQISNYNNISHLYDGNQPYVLPPMPENYHKWKAQLVKLCQQYLGTHDGNLLLDINALLAAVPYKKAGSL